jgi:hypothetical protein
VTLNMLLCPILQHENLFSVSLISAGVNTVWLHRGWMRALDFLSLYLRAQLPSLKLLRRSSQNRVRGSHKGSVEDEDETS